MRVGTEMIETEKAVKKKMLLNKRLLFPDD